jgi:hypothetical protein
MKDSKAPFFCSKFTCACKRISPQFTPNSGTHFQQCSPALVYTFKQTALKKPLFLSMFCIFSSGLSKINFHFGKAIMEHSVACFPRHVLANKFSFFKNYQKFTKLLHVHKNANNVNINMLIWNNFHWPHYLKIHHFKFPYIS